MEDNYMSGRVERAQNERTVWAFRNAPNRSRHSQAKLGQINLGVTMILSFWWGPSSESSIHHCGFDDYYDVNIVNKM